MLARAVFAIVVMGLIAAGVLSIRQARLQAAHELTQARLRAVLLDERLAEKRALIAELSSPDRLRPVGAVLAADPTGAGALPSADAEGTDAVVTETSGASR